MRRKNTNIDLLILLLCLGCLIGFIVSMIILNNNQPADDNGNGYWGENQTVINVGVDNQGNSDRWVDFKIQGNLICREFVEVTESYSCELLNETNVSGRWTVRLDYDEDASPEWEDVVNLEGGEKYWYNHTIG